MEMTKYYASFLMFVKYPTLFNHFQLIAVIMENAELYSVYNSMQKKDTISILKEYGPKLSWSVEEEHVLDVGCGPGDVTAEIVLPQLPPYASVVSILLNYHSSN